jgi:DNA-binding transcriptional LysR family regulator
VRLTPAGRRLAEHAVGIVAAVEAARLDLAPGADPRGTVRVAGFRTAISRSLLPVVAELAVAHPRVRVLVREHEPAEALALLAADEVDLALTYDYTLAPRDHADTWSARLWSTPWGLGVPEGAHVPEGGAADVFAAFRDHAWIGNSRNTADEQVIGVLAAAAGFRPRFTHQADSLDLVGEMIAAGLGVGLLPLRGDPGPGVRVAPLRAPEVRLRTYAVARHGRRDWAPLALVTARLGGNSR